MWRHPSGGTRHTRPADTVRHVPHDTATLAAFNAEGDTRMIWASHRDDRTNLVYLEDGTVTDEFRAYTRAHLACVIPQCDVPITAHARRHRRHGFAHIGTADPYLHSPESLLHRQGKAAVHAWLQRAYPDAHVQLEATLDGGQRRPDVLAVSARGNRVAFEVQYSSLDINTWTERHRWYRAHAITDVWLFGASGPNRLRTRQDQQVRLNALQTHMLAAGVDLWWIEPLSATIGTPATLRHAGGLGEAVLVAPERGDRDIDLLIEPLNTARLTAAGLRTVAFGQVQATTRRRNALLRAARAAEETDLRHSERVTARRGPAPPPAEEPAPRAQKAAFDTAVRRELITQDAAEQAWRESGLGDEVIAVFGEHPPWLQVPFDDVPETALGMPHRHWQCAAYLDAWRSSRLPHPAGMTALTDVHRPVVMQDFLTGVNRTAIEYSPELLLPLMGRWLIHLREVGQLGEKDSGGRSRIKPRVARLGYPVPE